MFNSVSIHHWLIGWAFFSHAIIRYDAIYWLKLIIHELLRTREEKKTILTTDTHSILKPGIIIQMQRCIDCESFSLMKLSRLDSVVTQFFGINAGIFSAYFCFYVKDSFSWMCVCVCALSFLLIQLWAFEIDIHSLNSITSNKYLHMANMLTT